MIFVMMILFTLSLEKHLYQTFFKPATPLNQINSRSGHTSIAMNYMSDVSGPLDWIKNERDMQLLVVFVIWVISIAMGLGGEIVIGPKLVHLINIDHSYMFGWLLAQFLFPLVTKLNSLVYL